MKRVYLLVSLFIILMLTACGGSTQTETQVEEETERETETETEATPTAPTTTDDEPASEATESPDAYPGPGSEAPAPTKAPEGYPSDPALNELPNGYPGAEEAMVWVIRALGEACEAPDTYQYADLEAAVGALEEAGVTVAASETVERAECEACDCPTAEHFRAQIRAQDAGKAQELGWSEDIDE